MKRRTLLMGGASVGFGHLAGLSSTDAQDSVTVPRFVLVAGQSNATSAGTTGAGDVPDNLSKPDPNLRIWNPTQQRFATYAAGVNSIVDETPAAPQQWGIEAEFSRLFRRDHPGSRLDIVKRAKGSTYLAHDNPKHELDWSAADRRGYYYQLLQYYHNARHAWATEGIQAKPAAMLWMQGENDSQYLPAANAYAANLTEFFRKVRADTGLPDLKIIVGRISVHHLWPYVSEIRAAQVAVVERDPLAAWVDTDDLRFSQPFVHYDPAGVVELGGRMYSALAKL